MKLVFSKSTSMYKSVKPVHYLSCEGGWRSACVTDEFTHVNSVLYFHDRYSTDLGFLAHVDHLVLSFRLLSSSSSSSSSSLRFFVRFVVVVGVMKLDQQEVDHSTDNAPYQRPGNRDPPPIICSAVHTHTTSFDRIIKICHQIIISPTYHITESLKYITKSLYHQLISQNHQNISPT